METLLKMWEYIASNPEQYFTSIWQHIYLDLISFIIILAISLPIGYFAAKSRRVSIPVIISVNIIMVVPTLSVLGLLLPYTGFGAQTAIIGLVIIGVPFMTISMMTAIRGVNPLTLENAAAMGMEPWRVCFDVELPLAFPTILNGIRVTSVTLIAGTTLATYVSAGGLGYYILNGLGMNRMEMVYVGALTVALIAICVDLSIASLQKRVLNKY